MLSARLTRTAWGARGAAFLNLTFIAVVWFFAYAQAHRVLVDHVLVSVPFALQFLFIAIIAICRRHPIATSHRPMDWLLAATSWLPLAMRPADGAVLLGAVGAGLGVLGCLLTMASMAALGRSFGIVAANRGLKTKGAYRIIRHPLYAAESLAIVGNLLANLSPINAVIVAVTLTGVLWRIRAEERILLRTADYASYAVRTRWRLVPSLY